MVSHTEITKPSFEKLVHRKHRTPENSIQILVDDMTKRVT